MELLSPEDFLQKTNSLEFADIYGVRRTSVSAYTVSRILGNNLFQDITVSLVESEDVKNPPRVKIGLQTRKELTPIEGTSHFLYLSVDGTIINGGISDPNPAGYEELMIALNAAQRGVSLFGHAQRLIDRNSLPEELRYRFTSSVSKAARKAAVSEDITMFTVPIEERTRMLITSALTSYASQAS